MMSQLDGVYCQFERDRGYYCTRHKNTLCGNAAVAGLDMLDSTRSFVTLQPLHNLIVCLDQAISLCRLLSTKADRLISLSSRRATPANSLNVSSAPWIQLLVVTLSSGSRDCRYGHLDSHHDLFQQRPRSHKFGSRQPAALARSRTPRYSAPK